MNPSFLISPDHWPAEPPDAGGKARALASLASAGFAVPAWRVVLPIAFVASADAADPHWRDWAATAPERWRLFLSNLLPSAGLEQELKAALEAEFPSGTRFAVRSSASDEDGAQHSFAGQLDSFLNVSPDEVAGRVAAVWRSGFSERVLAYRKKHGLPLLPSPPAVIVQRMVDAAAAGVAFGADPVSGRRGVAVVSAVRGLGDTLVSGETSADTFAVDRAGQIVSRQLAGTIPVLKDAPIGSVAELARAAGRHFGRPQDIEWALDRHGKLWLLQSRPITTLAALPEADGAFNLWDNSNIAESYGGVTTPLTFSFARRVYEEVYRQFCRLMGVAPGKIAAHDGTFRRMLGLIRGRTYYNLLSWHRVLALLPGYRLNREFMEGMMGVKEPLPAEAQAELAMENPPARSFGDRLREASGLARSAGGLIWNLVFLPRNAAKFQARLDDALREPSPPLEELRADELAAHYHELEDKLLRRWDAPLVNDFYAMVFFGALGRLCKQWCGDADGTLQNELLASSGGIISAEPARRVGQLAAVAARAPDFVQRLIHGTRRQIDRDAAPEFATLARQYLDRFGDRCLEELKLETPTLRDDPMILYRAIGRLALAGPPQRRATGKDTRRQDAEACVDAALRRHPVRALLFRWVLGQARERVRARENLRFERTRVFGRVRRVFVELGRRFSAADRLDDPRDIFHLTVDEILGFVDGTTACADLRGMVNVRRAEFDMYRNGSPPSDRFQTRGTVHAGNAFTSPPRASELKGTDNAESRRGIPCCAGIVRGPARVVLDPRTAEIRPGEILVASRTDPGWILLFPSAAGLLVEHGSLLSHSAIVSRELGLPAVVSVPGLTIWLRTGDDIELNGATGEVRRFASAPVS